MTTPLARLATGPRSLVLVRHGQSLGNIADEEARAQEAERLDLSARDADVELSDTGCAQADALGRHLAGLAPEQQPTLVIASPYERAHATARRALGDLDVRVVLDERLRERDLGQLDGLTGAGIRRLFADEADRRTKVGKFYYQPPGGESWADVALRIRSLLADLRHGFEEERLWLFTHQAVIMSFRYVLEGLSEAELMEIDGSEALPNCSITTYTRTDEGLVLEEFADASAVADAEEAPVTDEPSHPQHEGDTDA